MWGYGTTARMQDIHLNSVNITSRAVTEVQEAANHFLHTWIKQYEPVHIGPVGTSGFDYVLNITSGSVFEVQWQDLQAS